MTINDLANAFGYLDTLRKSGVTNMFGATPYLQREFSMSEKDAQRVLRLWMVTFDDESDPETRAMKAEKDNA